MTEKSGNNSQTGRNSSPNMKDDVSSVNLSLTASEIESLRKHKKQGLAQLRGKFKHLFEKKGNTPKT